MAQSPEYPDLKWVQPRSWTNDNRTSVQLIVIHTTEGHEKATSAEDGAAYDARRTDGTSTHYFHDQNSTVQCVRTEDRAHTARAQGNRRGIQHELCGRAGQTDAQWDDEASRGTLKRAAKQAARDAKKWGIPVRHLTVAEIQRGLKGFCGHHDITRAFPADGGTHTDPGKNFPWTEFLTMVRAELAPPTPSKEAPVTQPQSDETLKVTGTTGRELFEPDLPAGTVVSEDTVLQLAAIHAKRAAENSASTKTQLEATDARLASMASEITLLRQDPADMDDPESHPIVKAVRYALDNPAPEQA
jgi:hypothetical protein